MFVMKGTPVPVGFQKMTQLIGAIRTYQVIADRRELVTFPQRRTMSVSKIVPPVVSVFKTSNCHLRKNCQLNDCYSVGRQVPVGTFPSTSRIAMSLGHLVLSPIFPG